MYKQDSIQFDSERAELIRYLVSAEFPPGGLAFDYTRPICPKPLCEVHSAYGCAASLLENPIEGVHCFERNTFQSQSDNSQTKVPPAFRPMGRILVF